MNVTLRPNRDLLDPNFESYKLSLEEVPQFLVSAPKNIDHHSLSSLPSKQHIQAYSQQNCLHADPYVDGCVYYVDVDRVIHQLQIPAISSNFRLGQSVYSLPPSSSSLNEDSTRMHISIHFPTIALTLVYDGFANLYIFDTDRSSDCAHLWTLTSTHQPALLTGSAQLVESAFDSKTSTLHCVLASVSDRPTETPFRTKSSYVTYLEWLSFTQTNTKIWDLARHRRFIGPSFPDYVAFTKDLQSLNLFSERGFVAIHDTANPNLEKQAFAPTETPMDLGSSRLSLMSTTSDGPSVSVSESIEWSQTETSDGQAGMIHITFQLKPTQIPSSLDQKWVQVGIYPKDPASEDQLQTLNVRLKLSNDGSESTTLMDHLLYNFVQSESTWTVDRQANCLELHLYKKHTLHWSRLLHDVALDEKLISSQQQTRFSASEVEHIQDDVPAQSASADQTVEIKPSFNVEQLEEVDFTLDDEEDDFMLQRFDGETLKMTHQSALSGHQWLLRVPVNPMSSHASTSALCLRYDVDGLVWIPSSGGGGDTRDSDIPWWHASTFQAFGYVLASKRDHRFVTCPQMNSDAKIPFVAVADATKHVFIYLQPWAASLYSNGETQIRHRKSGDTNFGKVVHVARQHVVSLSVEDPIIGFVAMDKPYPACVVCTKSQLFLICISG